MKTSVNDFITDSQAMTRMLIIAREGGREGEGGREEGGRGREEG